MQVGYKKSLLSTKNLASLHIVNGATVMCCKQSAAGLWQVGDTHRYRVCVQHSSEAHLTVSIWLFVAARGCAIDRATVTTEE